MSSIAREPEPVTSVLQAAGVAALTTAAQHLLLYEAPLKPEERYALGVTAIGGSFALWAFQRKQYEALGALVVIIGAAALPVLVGYHVRREKSQEQINRSLWRRGLSNGRAAS